MTHTVEIATDVFADPRMPKAGTIASMGDKTRFEITVIADNPLSSAHTTISRAESGQTTIASERRRLIEHARKVGYAGIAQIADYDRGECVTFRLSAEPDDPSNR